jgi:hypothetical protein
MILTETKKERSLLVTPVLKESKVTKPKDGNLGTSSILLVSAAISIVVILLTFAAALPHTDAWFEQYFECRDKIIGFQQMGLYKSPGDFELALSYCDLK